MASLLFTGTQPDSGAAFREKRYQPGAWRALERIETFVSLMLPQLSLTVRRNNEAKIAGLAHDFGDLRAMLTATPVAPIPDQGASANDAVERAARFSGFQSAVSAIRTWAAGMSSSPKSEARLRAIASDLEANRDEILATDTVERGEGA